MPSRTRSLAHTALLGALLLPGAVRGDEPRFTPHQLRQDLAFVASEILANHPDPAHSFDVQAFEAASKSLGENLTEPLTRDEAWWAFATLNPLFADGHLFIALPDWRGLVDEHLEQGGSFFPFEVQLETDGALIVKSALGGAATPLAGARIRAIDGIDAHEVGDALLARAHGDTPAFRSELVSRRFWFYFWKLYGAKATVEIEFEDRPAQRMQSSRERPAFLADEASFERQFRFDALPCQSGLLTLSSFAWSEKDRVLAFTREAFSRVKADGIRTLIIDIRGNGGGDDAFWIEGVLPYIADRPYRWGATYRKRVLAQFMDAGETAGDIVTGEIDRWIQPQPENSLRFSGKVHLLIGPSTYSSAVLLSNVVQDFDFGAVAGAGFAARARQSGGIQRSVLPNTGLVLYWPRFVLERPAGPGPSPLVSPDILVQEDALDPRHAVLQLVAREAPGCAFGAQSSQQPRPHAARAVTPWKPRGISSPQWESHPAFDPVTGDLYFVRSTPAFEGWRLHVSRCTAAGWSTPEPPSFAADAVEADPYFAPGGNRLFFISTRSFEGKQAGDLDIWRVDRPPGGAWGRPVRLPEPVNSNASEWFPRLAPDGSLYFGSNREGGHGGNDIWRARSDAAGRWLVENLGPAINTAGDEYEPLLSSDGARMIVATADGLYESHQTPGGWSARRKLGPEVNANGTEIGPLFSPDERALLFSRDTQGPDSGEFFVWREADSQAWPPDCPVN